MSKIKRNGAFIGLWIGLVCWHLAHECGGQETAADQLKRQASWRQPKTEKLRADFDQWLELVQADELTREKVGLLLSDQALENCPDVLDQLGQAAGLVQPGLDPLVSAAVRDDLGGLLSNLAAVHQCSFEPAAQSIRLLVARTLVLNQFHDEALVELESLDIAQVWDPATLLFYRALSQHRLLKQNECIASIDTLFENLETLPARYRQVGQLIQRDIAALKQDSLDEVARLMNDINRRISLYRSGTRVIGQEEDVLEKLDKIIEELEKQQQQQQSSSTNPSSPMQDSRIAGGKGDGQAQSKNFGEGGEWGDMPPQKRAEAMAEMAKDLPPHYRQVIEEYFRKLAEDKN